MQTLHDNVYLRNVSREFEEKTIKGVCDLPIENQDVLSYFENYSFGTRSMFVLYHNNMVSNIYVKKPFTENPEYSYIALYVNKNDTFYTIGHYDNILYLDDLRVNFEQDTDQADIIYYDVQTIYDIYQTRLNCIQTFPNYVKQKTFEYFDEAVNYLNKKFTPVCTHLYLTVNCMVLGISSQSIIQGTTIDFYPQRIGEIIEKNNVLYSLIINKINCL
jgi:hypothetical protein